MFEILAIEIILISIATVFVSSINVSSGNNSVMTASTSIQSHGTIASSLTIPPKAEPSPIPWSQIFNELREWVVGTIGAISGIVTILEHRKKKKVRYFSFFKG